MLHMYRQARHLYEGSQDQPFLYPGAKKIIGKTAGVLHQALHCMQDDDRSLFALHNR